MYQQRPSTGTVTTAPMSAPPSNGSGPPLLPFAVAVCPSTSSAPVQTVSLSNRLPNQAISVVENLYGGGTYTFALKTGEASSRCTHDLNSMVTSIGVGTSERSPYFLPAARDLEVATSRVGNIAHLITVGEDGVYVETNIFPAIAPKPIANSNI